MIRWTGLAPWEFELPFPGSLASTFLKRPATQRISAPLWGFRRALFLMSEVPLYAAKWGAWTGGSEEGSYLRLIDLCITQL